MVHPAFSNVPDRYVAEAFSESMQPGEYKFVYSLAGTDFTPEDGFPPELATLTSMSGALIARDGVSISRLGMHGVSGPEFEPADNQLVEAYRSAVVTHSDQARMLEPSAAVLGLEKAHPRFGRLGQWCIDTTRNDGKRLIGAHLVFTSADGLRMHHALAYPRVVKDTFPLILRNAFADFVLGEGKDAGDTPPLEELPDDLRGYIQKVMKNTEEAQTTVAALPSSTVMPSLADFEAGLRLHKQSRR